MTTGDVVRILDLKPAGPLEAIDKDPLEENLEAEKEYRRYFQETFRLEEPERLTDSAIQQINLLYMRAEAWKELVFKRCRDCGSITLKKHKHCPKCRKILEFKRRAGRGGVSIWRAKCSCGFVAHDFREV